MLVTFNDVSFKYIDKILLNKVNFTINETDKIGLLGVNGTGKSTLLKLLVNELEPTSGIIYKKNNIKIAYLPQETSFVLENTILEEIARITKTKEDESFNMKSILNKLGLIDHERKLKELSGGEKKRLSLACTLMTPADLIILDEPTNHLDIWMINWLEKFLVKFNKAVLLVTHDRYFLERITKKIMELEFGNIHLYDGNYQTFLTEKVIRLEMLKASERKLTSILKKEEKWIQMNPQARSTKSKERIERFEKLNVDLKNVSNIIKENETTISLDSAKTRIGKKTIIIKDLKKSYNDVVLFENFNYMLRRFDRLGIIGKNGAGKTTLFKSILGLIQPDFGTIEVGETINVGYFSQGNEEFDENMRIIDYIKEKGEYIETTEGVLSASQFLENYLFSKTQQYMPIKSLSGGEKRRLKLVSILIQNPNVLFLDEPTNDLDIYTLEILEDYLEQFKGAIVTVSHDRYFLDKICDHFIYFEDGQIYERNGFVSEYMKEKENVKVVTKTKVEVAPQIKFTSSMKKEYEHIEEDIIALEEKVKKLEQEKILCGSDYQKLIDINNEQDKLNKEIEDKISRWEYLEEQYELYNKERRK